MATINGKAGVNDNLVGTDLNDVINGLSGNDTLTGGAGRDQINGGDGDDFLIAGGNGTPYDISAFHKAANDILDGGAGNDTAYLDYKDVVLTSTDKPIEITLVFGASFQLQIQGFVGATVSNVENLWISLPNGNDNVTLGDGDDRVWAGYGDDTVMAGGGDDVVQDVGGKSKFDGGDGNDTIAYDWSGFNWGMSFDLTTGKIKVSGTDAPVDGNYGTAIHFEQLSITGSTGFDTIIGGAKADVFNDYSGGAYFNGGGGDDNASLQYQSKTVLGTLIGGAGNDTLSGGFGTMYIDGGTGNDTLTGSAGTDDTIFGGDGNDIIHVSQNDTTFMDGKYDAGSGNDTVYAGRDFGSNKGTTIFEGGAGTDKLIIGLGNAKHFDALTEQGVQIANFATVNGFEQFDITGTDAYTGFDGGETIATLDLADVIRGLGGDDTLNGRGGDDVLDGGAGADKLIGGAGSDTASYADSFDPNVINLADRSKNSGDAAGDSYSSIENIIGGQDNDTITGDDKDNMLAGGDAKGYPSPYSDGDDIIDGGDGTDTAVFNHNFEKYTIVKQKDGSYLVTDTTFFYTNGADTLIDIEKLKFADKTVTLSSLGNTPPTGLKLSKADIIENAKIGTLIGKFSAKDSDGDALTYALTNDAKGAFDLHGTSLLSGKKFDYETTRSYSITLSVSDGTDTVKKTFTITVDDVVETIKGTSKANNLKGGIGDDRILGLAGNDTLTGGKGDDVFVFSTGYDKDKITDFDAKNAGHDRIDLSGLKSIDNFNDLKLHHVTGKSGDVIIDGGHGDVLTLQHVMVGDLAKADFIF